MGQRLGKTQAKALMAELIDMRDHLNRIITALDSSEGLTGRQWRNYDDPTPDPAEIAARYGLESAPEDGPVPPWVQERLDHMLSPKEAQE